MVVFDGMIPNCTSGFTRKFLVFLIVLLGLNRAVLAQPSDLIARLVTGDSLAGSQAAAQLAVFPADTLFGWITGFNDFLPPDTVGQARCGYHVAGEGINAPYYYYIPTAYDPQKSTPMLVYLHGGVSRPQFEAISDSEWQENDLLRMCEAQGWLGLFPMARNDCLWWNRTGMNNLIWLIRDMKRRFNVDDDRVVVGGFSDGASGSFHLALLQPTDFAFFAPWSGNMMVGTLVGGTPVYLPNLRNRSLFATCGGKDELYPTARMQPLIQTATDAGANLYFTSYDTAHHQWGYMRFELPQLPQRIKNFARRPLESHLYWETSDLNYGAVDWLEITELDTAQQAAAWHREYNSRIKDDRVSIGFFRNTEWKKKGMLVDSLNADTTLPAHQMGLKPGDIVVGLDEIMVDSVADYMKWRDSKRRGEPLSITVKRKGKTLKLFGALPLSTESDAFPHPVASGAVDIQRIGNTFSAKTSRVKSFRILIHPNMVRLDQPVTVTVNGVEKFNQMVAPDSQLLLDRFRQTHERRLLWVAQIAVES